MVLLLKLFLALIGILVVGAGGAVLLLSGSPGTCGVGRAITIDPAIGRQAEASMRSLYARGGTLTLEESEAASLAVNYAGSLIRDLKVCLESGLWQASGTLDLQELSLMDVDIPDFIPNKDVQVFLQGGITFVDGRAVVTGMSVRLGWVPELAGGLVEPTVRRYINAHLSEFPAKRPTLVEFGRALVTLTVQ